MSGNEVAIIGLACRFPGADNIDEFWKNLASGKESIHVFPDDELRNMGVDESLIKNPDYIKASGHIPDIEYFDAQLFGYNPREAMLMDPQQRLFLETAWSAMEHAGTDPLNTEGTLGVFAGCGPNKYFLHHIFSNQSAFAGAEWKSGELPVGTNVEALAANVAYKFGATGPCISVQAACSSSLTAVALASASLQDYRCDIAIAGGVALKLPEKPGYLYQREGLFSKSGHCRSFDASADGAVFGSGVGAVILKRLADAQKDNDQIYAVIKGWAVNNDGSDRAGYTAPGVTGQSTVIAEAQLAANVSPEFISCIEAHGSATPVGDAIEFESLTHVFRRKTSANNYCAIGSVKTNIGHLDAAAGIAGLIKTALALHHKKIPASLHFKQPAPEMGLDDSPFYVNTTLKGWPALRGRRIAGVSSSGLGGFNAHVILEQAAERVVISKNKPYYVLPVSAKSKKSLDHMIEHMSEFINLNTCNIADIAYTCSTGRSNFKHRAAIVCKANENDCSSGALPRLFRQASTDNSMPGIIFMFTGIGDQFSRMGLELYRDFSLFRNTTDLCAGILGDYFDFDIRDVIFPGKSWKKESYVDNVNKFSEKLNLRKMLHRETDANYAESLLYGVAAHPACFVFEYSLAKLFISWGIVPESMIGHSLGEYVAACISGVISVEDALKIIAKRAQLIDTLPDGAMLAAPVAEETANAYINEEISLAAVNTQQLCIFSGELSAIESLETLLKIDGITSWRVRAQKAYHSSAMRPVCDEFEQILSGIEFNTAEIPYISNVTGDWVSEGEPLDSGYWCEHLYSTVRFSEGFRKISASAHNQLVIEIGPGNTLSSFVNVMSSDRKLKKIKCLSPIKPAYETYSSVQSVTEMIAELWTAGLSMEWNKIYADENRYKVPVPTYSFDRKRYWIDREKSSERGGGFPSFSADNGILASNKDAHDTVITEKEGNSPQEDSHGRPDLDTAFVAPGNKEEKIIGKIWCNFFGYDKIGVNDDFLDLGGSSLLALQIANELSVNYGIELQLSTLLESSTIASLAKKFTGLFDQPVDVGVLKDGNEDDNKDNSKDNSKDSNKRNQRKSFPGKFPSVSYVENLLSSCVHGSVRAKSLVDNFTSKDLLADSITDILRLIKNELNMPVYPNEISGKRTISELSTYIVDQYKKFYSLLNPESEKNSVDEQGNNNSVGFILSSVRSGSTLLRTMLAGHSDLFCPPELHLMGYKDMQERQAFFNSPDSNQGLQRALMELKTITNHEAIHDINLMSDSNLSTVAVLNKLSQLSSGRLLIDKSPGNANHYSTLKRIDLLYPQAKFIILVRHPYSVIDSMVKNRFVQLMEGGNTDPYDFAEFVWSRSYGNILRFVELLGKDKFHLVRYEDLVAEPEQYMQGLCDFLHIPFSDSVLHPYRGRRMRDGLGDPNFLTHKGIDSSLSESWKYATLPDVLRKGTRDIAHALGYEI